jgi:hypothetical protein
MADVVTARHPAARVRSPEPARWRWRRTTRLVLLLVHVLGSVGWWGAAVCVAALVAGAAATSEPALGRAVGVLVWLTLGGAFAAAVTGVLLGLGSRWGVVRYRWVVVKEAIAVAVVVTDLALVRPGVARVLAGTRPPGALLGPAVAHVVVLTAATVLSVFKPWGRVRGDAPATAPV